VFLPVILWTDALVFLLLVVSIAFAAYTLRHEHLRTPWRRVGQSPAAMSSLVVLAGFVLLGLLDSLHYRPAITAPVASQPQGAAGAVPPAATTRRAGGTAYAPEVKSVLDLLLERMASRKERTYSAPLATHAFSRETVELPGGGQAREFPRLRFGGKHLADPAMGWWSDILLTTLRGAGLAIALWCAATAMLLLAVRPGHASIGNFADAVWRGETEVPWRAVIATLGLLLLVIVPTALLTQEYHVLGTDKVGQDVLYLSLKSIRTALVIGTLTTLVMLPFAVALGIMAGYFRGWIDDVIQYLYTTLNSIPGVLLIAASILVLQVQMEARPDLFPTAAQRADFRLLFLCIILGVTSWTGLCRLLRGETLKLRELDYVQAAQAFGVSRWRIMQRHILPNVMHIVLISVVMDFSGLVLAEAVLSYVGVGVDPSMISFGTMINAARLEMGREPMVWWSLASAFVFMLLLVLAANLFADAVRDAFDPRVAMVPRRRALAAA
jgi:peptide/nickel transport system permease protein